MAGEQDRYAETKRVLVKQARKRADDAATVLAKPVTPAVRKQVGSSSIYTKTGGDTAFESLGAGGPLGGNPQAQQAIIDASKRTSPRYKQAVKAREEKARDWVDQVNSAIQGSLGGTMVQRLGEGDQPRATLTGKKTPEEAPAQKDKEAEPVRMRQTLPDVGDPSRSIEDAMGGTKPAAKPSGVYAKAEEALRPPSLAETQAAVRSGGGDAQQGAVAPMSSDRIQQVFKAATGGSFDPKSRLDRQRLAEIQSVISSRPELADSNPNKIALAWYKSKKK